MMLGLTPLLKQIRKLIQQPLRRQLKTLILFGLGIMQILRLFGLKLKERISRWPSLRKVRPQLRKERDYRVGRVQGWVIGDRLLQRRIQGETFRSTLFLPRGKIIYRFDCYSSFNGKSSRVNSSSSFVCSYLLSVFF